MARLKHSELQVVSETLLRLYSPGPYAELPTRLISLLPRHFSCDNYCWNEFSDHTALRLLYEPAFSGNQNVLNHYIKQHPLALALLRDRTQSAVKISDFATLSQWQRSDLWNNFFRLEGLNYQLTFLGLARHRQVGFALNRSKRDFSEEERVILNLLGPHFTQVYDTSRLFSYLGDSAEGNGQAWIVVDSTARILFETGKAVDWLNKYFGHNGSLPTQLRDWLKRRAFGLRNGDGLATVPKDFSIQRGSKRLIVRSLSPVQSPEQRLLLSETNEELDAQPCNLSDSPNVKRKYCSG